MTKELGFHHQSMTTSPVVRHSIIKHEDEPFFTITSENLLAKISIKLPNELDLHSYKYDKAPRYLTQEPTEGSKKMFLVDFSKENHTQILDGLEIPYVICKKQKRFKGGRIYYHDKSGELIFSFESSHFGECDHFEFVSTVGPIMKPYFEGVEFKAMKSDEFILNFDGKLI